MVSLREIEETMSIFIRHQTHPLAIKLLRPGDEVPEAAKNPVRDFGVPFSLCQAFALGRKEGLTIVLDKNSQSCPIALAGLGLVKPEGFLNGYFVLAPINQSTAARKKMAGSLPRFP